MNVSVLLPSSCASEFWKEKERERRHRGGCFPAGWAAVPAEPAGAAGSMCCSSLESAPAVPDSAGFVCIRGDSEESGNSQHLHSLPRVAASSS